MTRSSTRPGVFNSISGTQDGTRTRTPPCGERRVLSPLRLPISPPGPRLQCKGRGRSKVLRCFQSPRERRSPHDPAGATRLTDGFDLEARAGVEPTYSDLQSGA